MNPYDIETAKPLTREMVLKAKKLMCKNEFTKLTFRWCQFCKTKHSLGSGNILLAPQTWFGLPRELDESGLIKSIWTCVWCATEKAMEKRNA